MTWYEIQTDSDCITPTEWNNMATYIQHSACTDFTVYGTCPSTGQAFRFTQVGTTSQVFGDSSAGGDLELYANDTETQSRIKLFGAGDIWLDSGNDIIFKENGVEKFKFYDGKSIDFAQDRAIHIDDDETYFGHGAGDNIGAGTNNTLVGHDAGQANTFNNSTFFGYEAGKNNTQNNIVAVGYHVLSSNSGERNTGCGYCVLSAVCTGTNNTAFGYIAGQNNTIGTDNTFIGDAAGLANTEGNKNTCLGRGAGQGGILGDENVHLGYYAGKDTAVNINKCVYVGVQAGQNNTQSNIVAIGYQALDNNTGTRNTAVGYLAASGALTGASNTVVGNSAGLAMTSAIGNVLLGEDAGLAMTTGNYNTYIGQNAGDDVTSGLGNTFVGNSAGHGITGSNYNVAIGMNAGLNADVASCIYIGYTAGINNAAHNRLYINNGSSTFPLIYGEFDNDIVKIGNNSDDFGLIFDVNTAGIGKIYGGDDTTDDLYLMGNTTDGFAGSIKILGNSDIIYNVAVNRYHTFQVNETPYLRIANSGTAAHLIGQQANADIFIAPHGTGVVKFGTYVATPAADSTGYITIKDSGGTTRKVMIQA